ncbi:MAG: CoA transferase [Acidimicrobiia bacterium]|nr:CoA transferase [Acidimicrobiia bacterium]
MLNGMRVVDCSTGIAGGYCTKLLADAGADVVKVEPAGGDPLRTWRSGALFEFLHTSKRSIVGAPDAADVLDLCARADIVVESGRPGTFPAEALFERRPDLVIASITPFGQEGPWAQWAATEFTLQAWCGSTSSRGLPEQPPVAAGGRIGEWVAGTYAAVGALAATFTAARTGAGEHVDVAWLEAMSISMNTFTSVFAELSGWPDMRRPIRTIEIPSIEPSADGFASFTTNSAPQWASFLVLIDRHDLDNDKDLAGALGRFKRRDEALEIIRAYTTQHTTAELLDLATELRIPCGPVGNAETITTFDQFVDRGTFVPNPSGRFVQPRVPYRISGLSPRPFDPAPDLNEHARAIDWPEERVLESVVGATHLAGSPEGGGGLPLEGIRVLDLTAWWAGPAATAMLANLGADVIKIESITRPDFMRYTSVKPPTFDGWWEWGPLYHGANNSKRGITLDLTRPVGRELVLRMCESADVILDNFTPRVMEQFELDWEHVSAVNPRLIQVRMPAYGLGGPWRDRTGFAQTMEAITGMAWVTGWPDGPPVIPRGACDPLAAQHAVFATLLALRDRETSGEGRFVEVTMIEAALNIAAEQLAEFGATGEVLGRTGNRGPTAAPQNLYACEGHEEWLALAIENDEQWDRLREFLGAPAWADDPALDTTDGRRAAHDQIDEEIERFCKDRDARTLAMDLAACGVPAGYVTDGRDIAVNPQMLHRGFFEVEHHAVTGPHNIPTIPFRFARHDRGWVHRPAPTLGQHNDEVLRELLGLSDEELAALRADQLIGERPVGA